MSEEVKFELVFGPQELFDCASDDAVLAIKDTTSGRIHIFTNDGWIKSGLKHERHIGTSDNQIAMRRIIAEPKCWTVADQKAGKLPVVGSMLNHKTQGECTFIGFGVVDKTYWALKLKNDLIYIADKNWCTPIELPEVKAARLREEWKNNVIEIHHGKRRKMSTSTFLLDDIYDALLSGELQAPKWE